MATKKPQQVTKSDCPSKVVEPLIRSNDEKHLLEEMFEAGDFPEMKAVGYAQIGKSASSWVSYTLTLKGDKVTKLIVSELNPKAIADESAKVDFVTYLSDQGPV